MKTSISIKIKILLAACLFCLPLLVSGVASAVCSGASCSVSRFADTGSGGLEQGGKRVEYKCTKGQSMQECTDGAPIVKYLNKFIDFAGAGVGIVIVGVIIVGGIQYTTSGDNPTAVAAAKARIANGALAFLTFLFMWALLQWVVPGGIF